MAPTYYIRHTHSMWIDDPTWDHLWAAKKIALHYPTLATGETDQDARELNPDLYKASAKKSMRAFHELRKGAYVLAEYPGRRCLVGWVEPQEIALYEGKWDSRGKPPGRVAVLKTLQVSRVQEISASAAIAMLAGRPIQGTICRWHNAGQRIARRVEGKEAEDVVESLDATAAEVLCAEFLRLPTSETNLPQLAHLILPVGRTLRDVDIFGLDVDGSRIAVQVTFHRRENAGWKIERLKKMEASGVKLVFFLTCSASFEEGGIQFYPLQEAYRRFVATPTGRQWFMQQR